MGFSLIQFTVSTSLTYNTHTDTNKFFCRKIKQMSYLGYRDFYNRILNWLERFFIQQLLFIFQVFSDYTLIKGFKYLITIDENIFFRLKKFLFVLEKWNSFFFFTRKFLVVENFYCFSIFEFLNFYYYFSIFEFVNRKFYLFGKKLYQCVSRTFFYFNFYFIFRSFGICKIEFCSAFLSLNDKSLKWKKN